MPELTMTLPYDPNFEGLLREAAAAPRSSLLRVDRSHLVPTLRSRETPASVAMAGLSGVEKELLSCYRAELGFVVRQATLSALMNSETCGPWIDNSINDSEQHAPVGIGECESHLRNTVHEQSRTLTGQRESEELARIAGGGLHKSVLELAALSLRIEPLDQPRIYAGVFLACNGKAMVGIDSMRVALDGSASTANEVFAREATALAFSMIGEHARALNTLRDAVSLGYERAEVPLRYLLYSILSGDLTMIRHAIGIVDDRLQPMNPAIARVCQDIASHTGQGRAWVLSSAAKQTLTSLVAEAERPSSRIIHEIAQR